MAFGKHAKENQEQVPQQDLAVDSTQEAAAPAKSSILPTIINIVTMVAGIVILSILLRMFVFQPYEIPSGSMETTIMTNDMVFSEKVTYYFSTPQRGDIVTFADPMQDNRTLIKRVIATEGQTVELKDGVVYVDGEALDEEYTHGLPSYDLESIMVNYPYTVPEGYIWVMGDNRTNSQDSRYFGAVPVSSVTGKAVVIYWPLNRVQLLS